MFLLYPHTSVSFACPVCQQQTSAVDTIWQGIHLLASCHCPTCELAFYHTFPVKHALWFPLAFARTEKKTFPAPGVGHWFYQPLFDSYYKSQKITVPIRKMVVQSHEKVVILNCLDYLYGHVLLQLLNAQRHLQATPNIGLIVLLPKALTWLIPNGIAEIWEVDVPVSQTKAWIENLDGFVKAQLPRFQEVYVSQAFIQPDWKKVDLTRFTRTPPFDLKTFAQKPLHVTFLWREDRFWLGRMDEFLWKVAWKTQTLAATRKYFLYRQKQRYIQTARQIQKQFPSAQITVAGLGKTGTFPAFFQDLRYTTLNEAIEKDWCQCYANSHVVIGIHGSHMLLPSALAAAFVELLPRYRIDNITEDIAIRPDVTSQLFLGRILDSYASPALVAAHVVQIYKGFPFLLKNQKYLNFDPV